MARSDSRERILDAAERLFADQGVAAVVAGGVGQRSAFSAEVAGGGGGRGALLGGDAAGGDGGLQLLDVHGEDRGQPRWLM